MSMAPSDEPVFHTTSDEAEARAARQAQESGEPWECNGERYRVSAVTDMPAGPGVDEATWAVHGHLLRDA